MQKKKEKNWITCHCSSVAAGAHWSQTSCHTSPICSVESKRAAGWKWECLSQLPWSLSVSLLCFLHQLGHSTMLAACLTDCLPACLPYSFCSSAFINGCWASPMSSSFQFIWFVLFSYFILFTFSYYLIDDFIFCFFYSFIHLVISSYFIFLLSSFLFSACICGNRIGHLPFRQLISKMQRWEDKVCSKR